MSISRIRRVTANHLILLGVVLSLGVAACAASGADTQRAPDVAPITIAVATTSTPTTTTTNTTSTTSTTTTTPAPTTTIAPIVEVADECGVALDRLDGGVEIRSRMETIDMVEEDGVAPVSLTDFTCHAGTFEVKITNDTATPLGLHANFAMFIDNVPDDALQSSYTPIVVWSIEPGATETVSGQFADSPQSAISCRFEGQVFDAEPSSADASLGTDSENPQLTGEDPTAWFPAMYDFERVARTSGDIDLVASMVDVRSMSYDEMALAISDRGDVPDAELLEVCERGRSRPDADHVGFVYLERLASGETQLSHGLFRRGADGQWRWLGFARYYESILSADCSGVDPEF